MSLIGKYTGDGWEALGPPAGNPPPTDQPPAGNPPPIDQLNGRNREDWQKAMLASSLPPAARLIALAISVWAGESGAQGVWFSLSDIYRITGMIDSNAGGPSVRHYLLVLHETGWIRSEANQPRYLTWPRKYEPNPHGVIPHHSQEAGADV